MPDLTVIAEPARAKLNLALHIRHRRADGYHELETLFAFVEHGDIVRVAPATKDSFTLTGPFASVLAAEGDNLVTRAAARFRATFGGGAHAIELEKHLPVASGIGGGSADAAATLRALARIHGVDPADPRLFAIADRLGSDVPACLLGRTALGQGRGERLLPIEGLAGTPALLVNPGVAVSTAAVFRGWDGQDRGPIGTGDLLTAAQAGRNDLERPARVLAPEIDAVLAALAAQPGVLLFRMSGSGATCFALLENHAARDAAARALRLPGWWVAATALC
ncbi:4-(cytidine 5'-diphospho)-2-C-methyl-D-erythritol kinase [Sphingomonas sp. HT-1]|uniref:4-(cytidine 5'-diphospho)-2-C-methyl-D-erythritol kinase n=1 Tax=unclassified Sphingomonas TaxID=196159 RepID=UPI000312C932|nr:MULTISPECIES: 4-(cytidine 5'-diphospho)-2-C-methyl-D-erythritol kinase [unclassified Sphingomonas]KTF67467.1 4-diphosphocytidyl-2C-methyl-D-erythritol kinase [Sphingomonas sp. WG]